MNNMQKFGSRAVYDSIWGDIQLTNCEYRLINSQVFQRLKHIKQMSLAYIGHAGAQHTRFEHSLGCLYVADYLTRNMVVYDDETVEALKLFDMQVEEGRLSGSLFGNILTHVRIAALLHDIGHAPMSHLFEEVSHKYPKLFECNIDDIGESLRGVSPYCEFTKYNPFDKYGHEKYSVFQILLDKQLTKIFNEASVQKEWIAYLIDGYKNGDNIPSYLEMFRAIISGDFDADRIDYINRDFNRCGINSVIDLPRYAMSLNYCAFETGKVDETGQKQFTFKVIVNTKYIMEISNLLFQRYMLTRRVHQNDSTVMHEQIMIFAIAKYLEKKKEDKQFSNIEWIHNAHTNYRDSDMVELLKNYMDNECKKGEPIVKSGITLNSIIDGSISCFTSNKVMIHSLSPIYRYPAHYISEHKELTKTTEELLKDMLVNKGAIDRNAILMCHIQINKPSKMEITAIGTAGKKDERVILDSNTSSLPLALFDAGISSMQIVIYSDEQIYYQNSLAAQDKQKMSYELAEKELEKVIDDARISNLVLRLSEDQKGQMLSDVKRVIKRLNDDEIDGSTRAQKGIDDNENTEFKLRGDVSRALEDTFFKEINSMADNLDFPIGMIMLMIYQNLMCYAREILLTNVDVRIKGDGQFHNFSKYVIECLGKCGFRCSPKIDITQDKFSIEILKITESLTNYGYLDRVYKAIRFK